MPLINYKVKLKLKWIKYCVFSDPGTENDIINVNVNANNIIFTIKDTKLCFCSNSISKRQPKIIKTS